MSRLKQIAHNFYTTILETISMLRAELNGLSHVRLSSPLVENLGRTLSDLLLLVIILVFGILQSISNLLLLTVQILMKPVELLMHIVGTESSVRYTLCRWADAVKNMPLMLRTWQKRVWKKDGDLRQDSTYPYSEMHGALDQVQQERLDKAMKAPIKQPMSPDEMRQKGLI